MAEKGSHHPEADVANLILIRIQPFGMRLKVEPAFSPLGSSNHSIHS